MGWKVAHACVRGSSHVRSGAPNQDAALCSVAPGADTGIAVVAVSDGHGGARHFRSQIGSSLAVSTAVATLQEFLPAYAGKQGAALLDPTSVQALQHNLVEAWTASVSSDLANNPISEEELNALEATDGVDSRASVEHYPLLAYGATLLIAAATDSLMLYLQLGDGEILSVGADGHTIRPLPADERLIGNQTTSLCQPEAWKEFRTAWVAAPDLPAVVLLSTDGYANSFRSDEDFLKIGSDYLGILREQGISALSEELPQILGEATQQGSGDDITLAILQGNLWKAAGDGESAPLKPKLSTASRSALIEQLKARHSSQHRRIDELATRLEATRKSNRTLQIVVLLLFLAAAGGAAYYYRDQLFHHQAVHYDPGIQPPRKAAGDKKSGSPDGPAKPARPDAKAQALTGPWQLKLSADNTLTLTKPLMIKRNQIVPGGDDRDYAEIAGQKEKNRSVVVMINRGADEWTVTPKAGKKKAYKVKPGGQVELTGDTVEIEFAKDVKGTLSLAPAPETAAPATPPASPDTSPLSPSPKSPVIN